jgi:cyclase
LTVVCGHGPVAGSEVLDANERYLRRIADLAVEARPAGLIPQEAARQADLSDFAHLLDPERTVGNLHRAYAELAGVRSEQPLDPVAVMADMVAFNGGRPLTCLA